MSDAMDFRDNLGEAALMAYINKLSRDGAALMVKLFGTESRGVGGLVAPAEMQVIPPLPSPFTLLRPYLAHFPPKIPVFCAFSPS